MPGHTRSHVAYFAGACCSAATRCSASAAAGCSKGTLAQMHASLSRLAALPPDTRVCCGHEPLRPNAPSRSRSTDPMPRYIAMRRRSNYAKPESFSLPSTLAINGPAIRSCAWRRRTSAAAIERHLGAPRTMRSKPSPSLRVEGQFRRMTVPARVRVRDPAAGGRLHPHAFAGSRRSPRRRPARTIIFVEPDPPAVSVLPDEARTRSTPPTAAATSTPRSRTGSPNPVARPAPAPAGARITPTPPAGSRTRATTRCRCSATWWTRCARNTTHRVRWSRSWKAATTRTRAATAARRAVADDRNHRAPPGRVHARRIRRPPVAGGIHAPRQCVT